jgi:hypothetical protein
MIKVKESLTSFLEDLVVDGGGFLTVFLEFFKATPSTIKPFEASVLEWKVTSDIDVAPTVKINNQIVPSQGSMTVRPRSSLTYRLLAKNGPQFLQLGQVEVTVDKSDCQLGGITDAESILSTAFQTQIEADPELYFLKRVIRQGYTTTVEDSLPIVKVDETGIDLSLRFGKVLNNKPDPSIKADVRFNWIIIDDVIEPNFLKADISVSFPWWAYAIPGAVPGLVIAASLARDNVFVQIRDGLKQFAAILLQPPMGRRIVSIRTSPALRGIIETEYCPEPTPPQVVVESA